MTTGAQTANPGDDGNVAPIPDEAGRSLRDYLTGIGPNALALIGDR